jgi:hypothetical protein
MHRNNKNSSGSLLIMPILRRFLFAAAALLSSASLAHAQNYPSRPITLIIPFAPGGSTSIVGRGVADKMGELLGEKSRGRQSPWRRRHRRHQGGGEE